MGKIYIDYEQASEVIGNINSVVNEVQSTLESISGLYSRINSGDVYSGFSAGEYEARFNELKKTAFVKVPEATSKVNRLLAEARNQYAENEQKALTKELFN